MDYLFFDTELVNKDDGVAKICQFGYILSDKDFNILERGNIFINPGEGEDFSISRKRGITFDHPEDNYAYYFKCPKYFEVYPKIKSLLCRENTLLLGFGITNDLYYFECEKRRYNLDMPLLEAVDIQELARLHLQVNKRISMGYTKVRLLEGREDLLALVEHNAETDAFLGYNLLMALQKIHPDWDAEGILKMKDLCSYDSETCYKATTEEWFHKIKMSEFFSSWKLEEHDGFIFLGNMDERVNLSFKKVGGLSNPILAGFDLGKNISILEKRLPDDPCFVLDVKRIMPKDYPADLNGCYELYGGKPTDSEGEKISFVLSSYLKKEGKILEETLHKYGTYAFRDIREVRKEERWIKDIDHLAGYKF